MAVDKTLKKQVPKQSKEDRTVMAFQSKTFDYRSGL